jgi:HEAT repeat protein
LRLLAADASSAPVFEKLMRDKDEDRDIRQISAAALQAVKPKRFQEQAREVLLDKKEFDDIQATALTALTQFGDEKAVANDDKLMKRVDELGKGKSAKVKKPAKQFLSRYGSEK